MRFGRLAGLGLMFLLVASCTPTTPGPAPGPDAGAGPVTPVAPHAPNPPLSADDVSWLFPAPVTGADMASLIAIEDVTAPDPQNPAQRVPVWSQAAFSQFLGIADGPDGAIPSGERIAIPDQARQIDTWQIAGIRIDAGAPRLAGPCAPNSASRRRYASSCIRCSSAPTARRRCRTLPPI
jgi:hypothetical protein